MPAAGGAAAAAPAGAGCMGICCCIAGAGGWAYLAFVACLSRVLELVEEAEGLMELWYERLPGVGRNFAAEYSTTWYECLRIGKEGKGRKGVRGPITGLPSPVKNETNVPWTGTMVLMGY